MRRAGAAVVLVGVACLVARTAWPQEVSLDPDLLKKLSLEALADIPVVSVVSAREEPVAQAPGTVLVITEAQIRERGYLDLMDQPMLGYTNLNLNLRAAAEALRECQIVFISRSEAAQEASHIAAFAGKPVLTVGDGAGFAARGGVVGFLLEAQRVRFEISRAAAERARLKMHPQLLRIARLVNAADATNEGAVLARDAAVPRRIRQAFARSRAATP